MKQLSKTLVLLFALTLSTASVAEDGSELESWYFHFGLGLADTNYQDQATRNALNILNANGPDVLVDLGAYWPLNKRFLLGLSLNSVSDRYTFGAYDAEMRQQHSSLSAIYFPDNIGAQGFYLRGDLGGATSTFTETLFNTETSSSGSGVAIGGGYTTPLKSNETRVMFGLLLRTSTVDSKKINDLSAEVSWLF